jgi:hypothetical protein
MIPASRKCRPQLLPPHVEDDNAHVEDEHPLHPVQGRSLCNFPLVLWLLRFLLFPLLPATLNLLHPVYSRFVMLERHGQRTFQD